MQTLMPAFHSSVTSFSLSSSRFFCADATMTWTSVVRTFSAWGRGLTVTRVPHRGAAV